MGDSAWHHVVWVYDGGSATWKMYRDGVKGYDAAGFGSGRRSYIFGVGAWGNVTFSNVVSPFTGRLSRVAIYTSALTETRILAHAAEFLKADPPQGIPMIRSSGNMGIG